MRDVMCVGIGCLDVLVRGADLSAPFQGEAKNCDRVALEMGGDAVNQAVTLRRLGVDAGLITGLGRDVAPERVVEAVRRTGAPLVGLSALMTTTLPSMRRTIELLRQENLPCKVVVGGAVLTPEYAAEIGADFYARDAKATADIANKLFG